MDFTGKTVLITGGSRGIGRAAAVAFARKGARVAISFRSNKQAALETMEMLRGEGHLPIQADISRPEVVRQMVDTVVREFGRLDILVNNAGIFEAHPIDRCSYEEWQESWKRALDTNLTGAANACYCAARHMIRQGGGHIVNVSSRGAFRGEPGQPAYGASKAGMNAMGQSLAQALAPHHIFVGTVAPGFVETDMAEEVLNSDAGDAIRRQSPTGRVARPEEVAYCILFLASEQAAFTTGCILDINGASYLRT
ncbi:MAG: SDR family oxidoreductase [Phaeodactylibacter sp.]|nr:SDR family oxidoreductase [Phaeodactylibacter sp.]